MLVKELLDKTMESKTKLEDIAKEISVPYRKLTTALRDIGCEPVGKGKKGWMFAGENPNVLEQSIFTFVEASLIKSKKERLGTSKDVHTEDNNKNNRSDNNMSSKLDSLIKGKDKNESAKVYKGIYFDPDVAEFLKTVARGNQSELVNMCVREFLKQNGKL